MCTDFLTESQLGSLDHYYQTNVLEYRTLMIRYRQEEAVAERERCDNFPVVTMWAPIFGQILTLSRAMSQLHTARDLIELAGAQFCTSCDKDGCIA